MTGNCSWAALVASVSNVENCGDFEGQFFMVESCEIRLWVENAWTYNL